MKNLHGQIKEEQRAKGVRVIKPPHVVGFLDPDVCDEPLVPIRTMREDAPDANDLVDVTRDSA
jgi:hypothetical protein